MILANQNERIKILYQYHIIDTEPEIIFDELVQLTADICETPVVFISFIDERREWLKAKLGLTITELPQNLAFGYSTIQQTGVLIIPDLSQDQNFVHHPLVISEPYLRFYAGVPLIDASGFVLGCLSVMDFVPRQLNSQKQKALAGLAKQVMRCLDLHRQRFLEQNQNNWQLLFTEHPNPLWIYDSETLQYLDVNEAALAHYGYSHDEFLQMKITDIHLPEDISMLMVHLTEQNNTQSQRSSRWRHIHKNGQIIFVELISNAIQYGVHWARLVTIRDITENQKKELVLRENEITFNTIYQAIPVPLIISRVSDGLILYANQECQRTFYLTPEQLINCYTSELYFNEDEHQRLLNSFRESGSIYHYEIQMKRANGNDFWAIASLKYLKFNQEAAILKIFYDINEQKKSAAKLQAENKFLQTLFESIPLMIAIIDVDGKVQWVNPYLERGLGWSLQDFQSDRIWNELYPDPQYCEYVKDFIQTKQAVWADFKTYSRDGKIVDTSWTNIQLPNGQTVGIGKDITERKQYELALQAQLEREKLMGAVAQRIRQSLDLQDILNATVQEVRDLLQVDRVVVYQFAPDMSGTIVAESVGENWTVSLNIKIKDTCFQTGGGQDYYQGKKRAIANIYTAGLSECHLNLLARFEVKANLVVPIILEVGNQNSGSRLWGLLVAHQCSNPREWEENQLDLLDQLTVQIAIAIQQSIIFQQAQKELQQRQKIEVELRSALAEKEVLLKEVHHRVKNNLQIVSSLLQLQSQTFQDPEVIRALRESQNRIDSISLIHKNLYTAPNIGQLDVTEYINNLATSLVTSYQIVPGRIGLEIDIDTVSLDVDQAIACGLVINELISNALKHAFPNGRSGKITIVLHSNNNHIQMTVQDDGIGLPDELDWRNTNSLGLSLVYDLVTEQLEGNITVEHHQGTKFYIDFPQLTWHK
jgi:PAS domain S-box-containing protein